MKINIDHYNRMYYALKTIATEYQTPDQLKRGADKGEYGLNYVETLEMAYENIQQLAKDATRNVRKINVSVPKKPDIEQPPASPL
jgi:hypothetical protein